MIAASSSTHFVRKGRTIRRGLVCRIARCELPDCASKRTDAASVYIVSLQAEIASLLTSSSHRSIIISSEAISVTSNPQDSVRIPPQHDHQVPGSLVSSEREQIVGDQNQGLFDSICSCKHLTCSKSIRLDFWHPYIWELEDERIVSANCNDRWFTASQGAVRMLQRHCRLPIAVVRDRQKRGTYNNIQAAVFFNEDEFLSWSTHSSLGRYGGLLRIISSKRTLGTNDARRFRSLTGNCPCLCFSKGTKVFLTDVLHGKHQWLRVQEAINFITLERVQRIHLTSRSIFPVSWKPSRGFPVNDADNLVPLDDHIEAAENTYVKTKGQCPP